VAAGEATITVTTVDGEFTATCEVTVTNPSDGGGGGSGGGGGCDVGSIGGLVLAALALPVLGRRGKHVK
jgi:hypothetical protein